MTRGTLVGHGIRDSPIHEFPRRIVRARQTPGRCLTISKWSSGPGLISGFSWCWSRVKAPGFFAGKRVVRGNVAVRAISTTRATRDDLAFDDKRTRSVPACICFRLPSKLASTRIEADDEAVRCGVKDDILIDRERLGTSLTCNVRRNFALVFPN